MKRFIRLSLSVLVVFLAASFSSYACTAITLGAEDGAILFGRTMEWGEFDLNGRVTVFPRGYEFVGETPDKKPGLKWKGTYGVVGISMLGRPVLSDGVNEKGLALGLLYHPGYAEYAAYDPAKAGESMAPTDVAQYLLTTCATLDEVKEKLKTARVVPVIEPSLGIPAAVHFIVAEPSGKEMVIEFRKGVTTFFDAPLGALTNAPDYDWHITNLKNYINLSPVSLPSKKIGKLDFKPLGVGSGMIGLPGDFTPPSRFVRAVAFSATARKTPDGPETMYEMFRILDNFNVPLTPQEASSKDKMTRGMRSSTLWTVVYDTRNLVMYYHTQNDRRVRRVDVNKIDFNTMKGETIFRPLDLKKSEDFEDVTLQAK